MERFPVELLYVLAFVGFVLFNYFVNRAARRRQREEEALEAARPAPPPAEAQEEEEPFEDYWGRGAPPAPAAAPALVVSQPIRSAPPVPRAPRRLHPARALLNDKRDLRRAVVLMMVLGPCRAQEPLEPSGPQPQTKP